jgi:hypothetical protein
MRSEHLQYRGPISLGFTVIKPRPTCRSGVATCRHTTTAIYVIAGFWTSWPGGTLPVV